MLKRLGGVVRVHAFLRRQGFSISKTKVAAWTFPATARHGTDGVIPHQYVKALVSMARLHGILITDQDSSLAYNSSGAARSADISLQMSELRRDKCNWIKLKRLEARAWENTLGVTGLACRWPVRDRDVYDLACRLVADEYEGQVRGHCPSRDGNKDKEYRKANPRMREVTSSRAAFNQAQRARLLAKGAQGMGRGEKDHERGSKS